ncbi:MAG TPA: polysaccharide deacetylase family protein [Fibrobacteria bacterium]|nr:polysaccharide deacetylase family protein [Fibrobacteria bacterium]
MHTARFLVSLHDVTPRHEKSVESILDFLDSLGLPPAPLLVVPDFHGAWPLPEHPGFVERLLSWKAKGHELVLHGFGHLERPEDAARPSSLVGSLRRRFLTAGEGEFLNLNREASLARIRQGLETWERCGLGKAEGFVAPAWLFRRHLPQTLWTEGFTWTEDHQGIHFANAPFLRAPVITWASRDPARRIGSRLYAQAALSHWSHEPVVRIAIHPHDLDHPTLIRSIESTLRTALRQREAVHSPLALLPEPSPKDRNAPIVDR